MATLNENEKAVTTKEEPNYRGVRAMPFVIGTTSTPAKPCASYKNRKSVLLGCVVEIRLLV